MIPPNYRPVRYDFQKDLDKMLERAERRRMWRARRPYIVACVCVIIALLALGMLIDHVPFEGPAR